VVRLFQMCDRFHVLPRSGGLFDQDSLFIHILDQYLNWEWERAELDRAKANRSTNVQS
jgi:hypothetical protein